MGLSGLDIYKLLPKTNCRKCNFPTCLAFALALAKKTTELSKCPFVSDQAKTILESAGQPPIKLINIGTGDNALAVGNETVLFRHEEKFYHPAGIGLIIEDKASDKEKKEFLELIRALQFERVGQKLQLDLIAIKEISGNPEQFVACVKFFTDNTSLNLALVSKDQKVIKAGLEVCKNKKPLVIGLYADNFSQMASVVKEAGAAIVVCANDLTSLAELVKKATEDKLDNLILGIEVDKLTENIENLTQIRRLALKKNFRPFGFPTLVTIKRGSFFLEAMSAGALMAKYASIILLEKGSIVQVLSLLTLRQNIYSDPQKPLQVEPKVYPVGSPNESSPLLVTTNFSLTYYTVLSEVEASKVASYILSVDTEGMSVLTAWAAEKFTAEKITQAMKLSQAEGLVKHKRIVIPGYVAVMSADLEEASGWQVLVGPREASGINAFLKNFHY
jgi:acetyl-CoA decarbonylase/synthase complex subunit gamma